MLPLSGLSGAITSMRFRCQMLVMCHAQSVGRSRRDRRTAPGADGSQDYRLGKGCNAAMRGEGWQFARDATLVIRPITKANRL